MPTGSFSAFPLYCLSRAARKDGYKAVLSGEGSDELFCGYARNEFLLSRTLDPSDERVAQYSSMLRRFEGTDLDRFCRMASRSGLQGAALLRSFLFNLWSDQKSMVDNVCYIEARLFLQPLLQMADRMTMAHGLEARNPFLDHRIVEFAFTLDDSLKYRQGIGKWIVKAAAEKVLPAGSSSAVARREARAPDAGESLDAGKTQLRSEVLECLDYGRVHQESPWNHGLLIHIDFGTAIALSE